MINKYNPAVLLKTLLSCKVSLLCVFLLMQFISLSVIAAQNELKGVRAWPSPDSTRVVLDLANKPRYETHYLTKPDRLVIDLTGTRNKTNLSAITNKGKLITRIRESKTAKANTFRLVIDLTTASKAKIFSLPPAKPYGHRLVIDLPTITTKVPTKIAKRPNGRNIIVAIDAGHGGDDPGALGKYSYEKKITLQIAKRLKKIVDAQRGMQSFLIRKGDYFVNLNKRSEIARKGKADFLVSIHADGFTSSRPKGASVWVLSNRRATTELGRWMEKNEAQSELLGGAGDLIQDSDSVPFLNQMLLDMSMGNTMGVGYNIGSFVTNELSKVTTMHKKKPVHASLAVLKSPDIPSILVEAGFITNRAEERLLNQAEFQTKIANAVFKGIYKHFSLKPPQGTLFAQKKRAIKHTVRSGESLSILSKRYSISVAKLKSFNYLKSRSLKIGQVLSIPENYQVVVEPEPRVISVQQATTYTVKRGESLSVIASRYGKTTSQLAAYNSLSNTTLAVGQKIVIPGAGDIAPNTQPVIAKAPVVHTVVRGEYLSAIAGKYNKSIKQLTSYNKLTSTTLRVGQRLKIPDTYTETTKTQVIEPKVPEPKVPAPQVKEQIYTVRSGDALSIIAEKYATNMAQLKKANNLKSNQVFVGQKLKVPVDKALTEIRVTESKLPEPKAPAPQVKEQIYTVHSGDALSIIAEKYATNMAQLKKANNLKSNQVFVGQKLKVPVDKALTEIRVTEPKLPEPKAPAPQVKEQVYTVRSGDVLSIIAEKYATNMTQLKKANNLKSNQVFVGQKLKVPVDKALTEIRVIQPKVLEPKAPAPQVKEQVYTVRSGDVLSIIAEKYATNMTQLKKANNLKSNQVFVGQKLKVPASKVSSKPERLHVVKKGEFLSVIATKYETSVSALKSYNNLKSTSVRVGQKIKIPRTGASNYQAPVVKVVVPTKHKVKRGESLLLIAQRYDRSAKQFQAYNKLSSTRLLVGQVLNIPSADYSAPVRPSTHTVQKGQSLSVIASRYGVSTKQLKQFNGLSSNSLNIGQRLKIPTASTQKKQHKVRSGESLSVIAQRYGTTTHAIISTNNLRSKSLAVGQVLTIPVS